MKSIEKSMNIKKLGITGYISSNGCIICMIGVRLYSIINKVYDCKYEQDEFFGNQ